MRRRTPTSVLGPFLKDTIFDPELGSPTALVSTSKQNMGRIQKTGAGWAESGEKVYRKPDDSDKEEREAYGQPLPAAYRYIIGPAPKLLAGDRQGAQVYLCKIEDVINQGGWTKSEWRRLYAMQAKWKTRAQGKDPRFEVVGNRQGGLFPAEAADIRQRRIVAEMKAEMGREMAGAYKSKGD